MFWRITHYGTREVLLFSVIFVIVVVLAAVYYWPVLPAVVLLWLGVLFFFRDPVRRVPGAEKVLLAPADGKVVVVQELSDPDGGGRLWRVDIFLSLFNVHINRAPCAGVVESVSYRKGRFRNALRRDAASDNESNEVRLRTAGNVSVSVRQIAGVVARRIVCDCRVGDRLMPGEAFGMIKFGSRTQLTVPVTAVQSLVVKPGDRVRAGVTVIGQLR